MASLFYSTMKTSNTRLFFFIRDQTEFFTFAIKKIYTGKRPTQKISTSNKIKRVFSICLLRWQYLCDPKKPQNTFFEFMFSSPPPPFPTEKSIFVV